MRKRRPLATMAALLFAFSLAFLSMPSQVAVAQTQASSSGSSVGVVVDAPPPVPPATTQPPPPVTEETTPETTSTTSTSTTTSTTSTSTTTSTTSPLQVITTDPPDVALSPEVKVDPSQQPKHGITESVKSAVKATQKFVKGIASGKPVADVAEAVLPAPVAQVVVPAVRTASTFVFPISLAIAVIAYLALQQRVDSSDPKLSAAPIAHEDDVVTFS